MKAAAKAGQATLANLLRIFPGTSRRWGPVRRKRSIGEGQWLSDERSGLVRQNLGGDKEFAARMASHRLGRVKARSVAVLTNGRFLGRGWGGIVAEGDVLRLDLSPAPGVKEGGARGHPIWERPGHPRCETRAGSVAVLTAPQAENFHHWLLDCVPRAGMLADAGFPPRSWDAVIVPGTLRPWHREVLERLRIDTGRCIPATQRLHVCAGQLLAASWSEPGRDPEHWDYTPEGLDYVRRLFDAKANAGFPGRILVSRERAPTRRLVPAGECEQALGRLGFVKVILEDLTLAQQADLFAGADAVVMPTGGNLANFVHCRPGTLAVELFSPAYIPLFTVAFAGQLGLRYLPLVGDGEGKHSDAGGREDIRFDPGLLCERVAAMLA